MPTIAYDSRDSAPVTKEFKGAKIVTTCVAGKKAMKMWLQPGFSWATEIKPLMPGCPDCSARGVFFSRRPRRDGAPVGA